MSLDDLVNPLVRDTLEISLPRFRPELALCATIVAMLLVRIFVDPLVRRSIGRGIDAFYLALAGAVVALYYTAPWEHLAAGSPVPRQELFTGLLVYDGFTVFFRSVLMFFAVLFIVFTKLSGIPDREDSPDFYSLVLGGTIGMCLMASANHLLMVFLAVEMASVPSYALAGMLKGRRESSEAALKYAVYGAGAAGVMLYGISLIAGALGTVHLPTAAVQLAELFRPENVAAGVGSDKYMVLALGGLMISVGLAFKLSAVPFHFWCPDVFEGASAEVNAFLSVASKAAALALLVRVVVGFGHLPETTTVATRPTALFAVADPQATPPTVVLAQATPAPAVEPAVPAAAAQPPASADVALSPVRNFMAKLVALLAAITCTFGNLAAYGQTNIKRLLAYSTIGHAGYMMMPVAAALTLAGTNVVGAQAAVASICLYVGIYLFMNLGAFAFVAFMRNEIRSEEIADYAGLVRRAPVAVICFSAILFSLIGIPPLAGFIGKFAAFASLADAKLWALLVIGGLNTALSLFYYLRVVKVMTIDPEPEDRLPVRLPWYSAAGGYLCLLTAPLLLLMVFWDGLNRWALAATANLFS
ncbi:MAG: NADH-quinone oxidoreductase subunit N [Pirellulales bacterium]